MVGEVHISEAARQLGVSPKRLRRLESEGRIPPARRDFNGRVYAPHEVALLRTMGVGQRPRRIKRPEEVLAGMR